MAFYKQKCFLFKICALNRIFLLAQNEESKRINPFIGFSIHTYIHLYIPKTKT